MMVGNGRMTTVLLLRVCRLEGKAGKDPGHKLCPTYDGGTGTRGTASCEFDELCGRDIVSLSLRNDNATVCNT